MARAAFVLCLMACGSSARPGVQEPRRLDAIGFRTVEGVDATRPFGEALRPLRVGIWYPAEHHGESPMSIDEYGRSLDTKTARPPTSDPGQRSVPMRALRDARAASVPGHLIIYLPGFGANATGHALACERFAEKGYTVIAMASMGSSPIGMTFDLEGVEAQRRDAEWGIAIAEQTLGRRFTHIAIVGVSFGSLAGWRLLVGGDERFAALVSLDGSLGFVNGVDLMARHPSDRPPRQAVLHLNTAGNGFNDLSFLERQPHALVQVVSFEGYQHNEYFPSALLRARPDSPQAAAARSRLDVVLSLAERFIDAQLTGQRACVSTDTGRSVCSTPQLEVPSEETIARWVATADGLARLQELGRRAIALGLPQPVVREGALAELIDVAKDDDRLALVRLRVALFPRSFEARWQLGDELAERGELEAAIAELKAVKRIDPRVRDVDDEIAKLRARLGKP